MTNEQSNQRIINEEDLRLFAWDVYYKAISLISQDDVKVIDIDDEIIKNLAKVLITKRRIR